MQNSSQHGIEAITIGVSNKATIAGSTTAVVGSAADKAGMFDLITAAGHIDIASLCAIGGLLLALAGFLTSLYFQWRRDKREAASLEFERRMAGGK